MWNEQALSELIRTRMAGHRLIVVGNREPFIHRRSGDRVEWVRPASGMVAALDPLLTACGGVWIAHGSGDADRETADARGHVAVPPDDPRYTLRRVWLTKEQESGYYYGLGNEGIWPLCHVVFQRPIFRDADWRTYREVNELFARAVLEEAGGEPAFVFIQDYHFALLPRMLKEASSRLVVAQFWHIPWPNRETFRAFPWIEDLLDGLLGNDLLGFHLVYHCQNFLDTVDRTIEARVDHERLEVTRRGRVCQIRAFPIGIDTARHAELARGASTASEMERWRLELALGDRVLGIGIDRLDYTKGIPERLRALDALLERNPEWKGRLLFVQVGVPSRSRIRAYRELAEQVETLVEEINWKWGSGSWQPIVYLDRPLAREQMIALHRLARFCLVTSLHDGMNLVAKEFVASRVDEDGVLVLSRFTGAARELRDAIQVNPFSEEEMVAAIRTALTMAPEERRERMIRLREVVTTKTVYRWAGKIVSTLAQIRVPGVLEERTGQPS